MSSSESRDALRVIIVCIVVLIIGVALIGVSWFLHRYYHCYQYYDCCWCEPPWTCDLASVVGLAGTFVFLGALMLLVDGIITLRKEVLNN